MEILNLIDTETRAVLHALFRLKEENTNQKVYTSNTKLLKEILNKEICDIIDKTTVLNEFVGRVSKYDNFEISYSIDLTELMAEDGLEKD